MQITLKDYEVRAIREARATTSKALKMTTDTLIGCDRLHAAETYSGEWTAVIAAATTYVTMLLRDAVSEADYQLARVLEHFEASQDKPEA